jgi:hypothetical protein
MESGLLLAFGIVCLVRMPLPNLNKFKLADRGLKFVGVEPRCWSYIKHLDERRMCATKVSISSSDSVSCDGRFALTKVHVRLLMASACCGGFTRL